MLNFTVGPVQEFDYVLEIGACRTPYFRNATFSKIMLENECMIKKLAFAPEDAKTVFLTASGTGGMEATILNCLTPKDKALIINGGSFGERFEKLCQIHEIPYEEVDVPFEDTLTEEMLVPYEGKGFTALLINMHETSIGKLYDMKMVSNFCKKNHLFLIVDAISAFMADPIYVEDWKIDALIVSSQKALALPPGISVLILSREAQNRINKNADVKSMYFNLKDALANAERGQTPYTPAVGILMQMHERLRRLCEIGPENEWKRVEQLANYFRKEIKNLPLKIASNSLSNAVTPLWVDCMSAYELFETLEEKYQIWICPSGGKYKDRLFRIGHLGQLEKRDYDQLISALKECMHK